MEYSLPQCRCSLGQECPRAKALAQVEKDVRELGLERLGNGCSRTAYKHPFLDWVIKIPSNCQYMLANVVEMRMAESKRFPTPEMHLEFVHDVPVIHMEMLRLPENHGEIDKWSYMPENDWMSNLYDGCQVGKAKDGRVLVYDLGHEEGWGVFEKDPGRVRH